MVEQIRKRLNEIWDQYDFGPNAEPFQILSQSALKVASGYWVGSGSQSLLINTGLAEKLREGVELNERGRKFLWEYFSDDSV